MMNIDDAIELIRPDDKIFVHGSAATPTHLLEALAKRAESLHGLELISVSTLGQMALASPKYLPHVYFNSLFVSANIREAVNSDQGDYIPIFLSEIPRLFHQKILPLDVALIHVSPPDCHGFCSLGVSVDVAKAAVKNAQRIIAQCNPQMPRTHGDGMIHVRDIHALVEIDASLPEVDYSQGVGYAEMEIGRHCASLIEDGSTLQLGIGSIPDAILQQLGHCKDLGIHTEMFSDGVLDLLEKGVITNKYKKKHRQKITTSFVIGSKRLYETVHDNPQFAFLEADYVNDAAVIAKNPKVVAINSAIEIDITGQVCADSIGIYQYSGVGGQMDFIRGASLSEGGKPIIAMTSTAGNGASKIVPFLKLGAGVVTTRAHVHYVVTEYGIAYLYGKNLKQRAYALLQIAHPNHREMLEKEIRLRFGA